MKDQGATSRRQDGANLHPFYGATNWQITRKWWTGLWTTWEGSLYCRMKNQRDWLVNYRERFMQCRMVVPAQPSMDDNKIVPLNMWLVSLNEIGGEKGWGKLEAVRRLKSFLWANFQTKIVLTSGGRPFTGTANESLRANKWIYKVLGGDTQRLPAMTFNGFFIMAGGAGCGI